METAVRKMNPQIKAEWIAALRSGNYKQGVERLRVLCDLMAKDKKGTWTPNDTFQYVLQVETDRIPALLREWLGIDADSESELIDMNDGHFTDEGIKGARQLKFNQIADWIEENL